MAGELGLQSEVVQIPQIDSVGFNRSTRQVLALRVEGDAVNQCGRSCEGTNKCTLIQVPNFHITFIIPCREPSALWIERTSPNAA